MAGITKPKEILATLDAMLRVVTPDHPFQPVLAASIDPNAWRAVFVQQCKMLKEAYKDDTNTDLQLACEELHDFAATIFRDSYFKHFLSAQHPDRDAEDFAPDNEFFETNPHWLGALSKAQPGLSEAKNRLKEMESGWADACRALHHHLKHTYAPILTAVIAESSSNTTRDSALDWLSAVDAAAPDRDRKSRDNRVMAEVFLSDQLLPHLEAAALQTFPATEDRSKRQTARTTLGRAASHAMACQHLRSGWETLLGHTTAATALEQLIAPLKRAVAKRANQSASQPTRSQLFESLRHLPPEVLDERLRRRWEKHLTDPKQLQAVRLSLQLLAFESNYVGKNALGKRLQAAANAIDNKGFTDKADVLLHTLGSVLIAIHGSENWIPSNAAPKNPEHFRKPRDGFGWLVNPLLVLWDSVYKDLL